MMKTNNNRNNNRDSDSNCLFSNGTTIRIQKTEVCLVANDHNNNDNGTSNK